MDEETFVSVITEGQPAPPAYFEFDATRNRGLRPLLDETLPPLMDLDDALARAAVGALLLDVREPADFAAGHLRGAVNIGLQGRFAEWAGSVVGPGRDIILVGSPASALEAKVRLGRIGYDGVVGQLEHPGRWLAGRPELHEASSQLTIERLAELQDLEPGLQLVDVRSPGETARGTLPGGRRIPLAVLTSSLSALDPTAPVVVYCASGYRSHVAASVLREAGFADVSDLLGGFTAWEGAERPVSFDGAATPADVIEFERDGVLL